MKRVTFAFVLLGLASCTSPEEAQQKAVDKQQAKDNLTTLEALASLHDSWEVANASFKPTSRANIAASAQARFAVIRSKATLHEVIDGNEVSYSAKETQDGATSFKDCLMTSSTGGLTIAGDQCVLQNHKFSFSGRPVQCLNGVYSVGKGED